MPFPFAAIAGAVIPQLVGGILGRGENKRAESSAKTAAKQERRYFIRDKASDRRYAASLTKQDRAYGEKMLAGDRRYAASIAGRDRALALADEARNIEGFKADRAEMQKLSDTQAERAAASRGIDFARMRDEAVAAGFNPLTAMQFASSYSKEVDYHNGGSAYAGPGVASGGSVVPMSSPASSHAAPSSSYSGVGGGYQREFQPALSTSSFVSEMLDAGITAYNQVTAAEDAAEQNIAGQVARSQLARELDRQNYGKPFGFSLSKVRPYQPSVSAGGPALNLTGLDRPVDVAPTPDEGFFGQVEVSPGHKVTGLNPNLDMDGPLAWLNEFWLGGNAVRDAAVASPYFGSGRRALNKWAASKPYLKGKGASYSITGSTPHGPRLGTNR
jgi:hypothetical protein